MLDTNIISDLIRNRRGKARGHVAKAGKAKLTSHQHHCSGGITLRLRGSTKLQVAIADIEGELGIALRIHQTLSTEGFVPNWTIPAVDLRQ